MSQKIKNFAFTSWPYLIFIAVSLIMLPTSFLYQVSPIGDINTMIAMGRALANGTIPFIDIFEQRGPYMYLLHVVGILPGNALHWIYIVELINFYIVYKIIIKILLLNNKISIKQSRWISTAALSILMFSPTIWYGASPEEFCYIPITYTIYIAMKWVISQKKIISQKEIFFVGLGFSWIIFIKYATIGIPVGFFLTYGITLIFQKKLKAFIQTIAISSFGVIIGALPIILIYGAKGKLLSAAHMYFIENTGATGYTLTEILNKIPKIIGYNLFGILFILIIAIPTTAIAIKKLISISKISAIKIISIFGIQFSMSLLIMRFLPTYMSVTVIFVIILSAWAIPEFIYEYKKTPRYGKFIIIIPMILVTITGLFFDKGSRFHLDTLFIHNKLSNLQSDPSYIQGTMIKNNGGGTIEVYADVARSIYQWSNSYPTLKYFDQTTIPYTSQPQAGNSQFQYMKTKQAKWVQYSGTEFTSKTVRGDKIKPFLQEVMSKKNNPQTSVSSISATIDAPIQRQIKYPSEYLSAAWGNIGHKTIVIERMPKPLMSNYVLVSVEKMYETKSKFSLKSKTINTYRSEFLFTTKENAQKHHLKAIPIKTLE